MLLVALSIFTYLIQTKDVALNLTLYPEPTYNEIVMLDVKSLFEVTLSENPTTGYQWMVLDQDLKQNNLDTVLKLVKESYQSNPPPGEKIVGFGGFKTLTFEVTSPG